MLDEGKYQRLLDRALPVVIQTEREYCRLLDAAKDLMEEPEEGRLLELPGVAIEEYEDRVHPLPKTTISGPSCPRAAYPKQLAEFFRVPVEVFL